MLWTRKIRIFSSNSCIDKSIYLELNIFRPVRPELRPVPPILNLEVTLKVTFLLFLPGSLMGFYFFPCLMPVSFAEVFVHRLQNAQIFHQSGKYLVFFTCIFLHFFSVFFLPAQISPSPLLSCFKGSHKIYFSFILGVGPTFLYFFNEPCKCGGEKLNE